MTYTQPQYRLLPGLVRFLVFTLFFIAARAFSQTVEINPQLVMPPNPSPYLSDWQSNPQTVILNTMVSGNCPSPVKLSASCSLNGQVIARTKFAAMRPIILHQGMNTFNAIDLVPYSAIEFPGNFDQSARRAGMLPEGHYDFCVNFVDAETNIPIAGPACNPFNVIRINPPVLISPANGSSWSLYCATNNDASDINNWCLNFMVNQEGKSVPSSGKQNLPSMSLPDVLKLPKASLPPFINLAEGDTRLLFERSANYAGESRYTQKTQYVEIGEYHMGLQNGNPISSLNFQWIPPAITNEAPLHYELRIVPVLPGQNPEQAFRSASPVFEIQDLAGTIYNGGQLDYHFMESILKTNAHLFAWSVQALDSKNNPVGNNNGWAAPQTFSVDNTKASGALGYCANSFFDIFTDLAIEKIKEPCGLHAIQGNPRFGPWRLFKSYSQYSNTWIRNIYKSYEVIDCGLEKGHAGPHHGSTRTVYVLDRTEKKNVSGMNPPPGNPPLSTDDDPSKKDQMSKDDMQKILDEDKGNNNAGNNGSTPGGDNGGTDNGNSGGTDQGGNKTGTSGTDKPCTPCPYAYKTDKGYIYVPNGNGTCKYYHVYEIVRCTLCAGHEGLHQCAKETVYVFLGTVSCDDSKNDPGPAKGNVVKQDEINGIPDKDKANLNENNVKVPCPEVKKTVLRTVAGSWTRVPPSKTTGGEVAGHVGAIHSATFTRTIWTVELVQHCTLERGHGGDHKWDAGHEEWTKVGTFTKEYVFGVGELQVPPKDAPGNELPQEDPPKGAITH